MGDLNAHNPIWGGQYRNTKGRLIEEFLRDSNRVLFNDKRPTRICQAQGNQSSIDLIMGHPSLRISYDWDVLPDSFGSDHFPTTLTHLSQQNGSDMRPQHWIMAKANFDLFKSLCEEGLTYEILETDDVMSTFTKKTSWHSNDMHT